MSPLILGLVLMLVAVAVGSLCVLHNRRLADPARDQRLHDDDSAVVAATLVAATASSAAGCDAGSSCS
jgi:threonine/homoserine/homoserine lactone efflux protein